MGLLDSVIGMVGGGAGQGGGNAALLNAVVGMLAGGGQGGAQGGGGLGAMLGNAQQAGLGDVVSSWIGKGQNLPISADQLGSVLGGDTLSNLAKQLGMSQGDAASQISQMLPDVVDRLTPQGQMPQGGLGNVGDLLGMLMKR
ncbi:MAG: hypothetical protein AD742_02200 [Methylibium sp. NZG]|nr:MAG: hypothetical protein AD742_02200 [Methylibium sp. NZG]